MATDSRAAATDTSTTQTAAVRIHALDWLRVFAVLGVFVYHTLRPFDTEDWHVKNAEQSDAVTVLLISVAWGLALFFLLAGAGSALALRRRTSGQYARERLLRLAVPLLTTYLLLAPVQAFLEETQTGRYDGSFAGYVVPFHRGVWEYLRDDPEFPLVLPWTGHLWFLVFLLWFSFLGLPVLLLLGRQTGRRTADWLGSHATRRGAVLLWAVPLGVLNAVLRAPGPVEHGWGEFALFFEVFLAGALLFADQRVIDAVRRDLLGALSLAVTGSVVLIAVMVSGLAEQLGDPSYSWTSVTLYFLMTVWAWAWMMVALSVGLRVARFQRPLPSEAGAAAMPFFLVHQPVILIIAFAVVQWDTGISVKWLAVLVSSFLATAALAVGLTRLPYVSALFGVKRRASPGRAVTPPARTSSHSWPG